MCTAHCLHNLHFASCFFLLIQTHLHVNWFNSFHLLHPRSSFTPFSIKFAVVCFLFHLFRYSNSFEIFNFKQNNRINHDYFINQFLYAASHLSEYAYRMHIVYWIKVRLFNNRNFGSAIYKHIVRFGLVWFGLSMKISQLEAIK